MRRSDRERTALWLAYVRAGLALGLAGGFGLGGTLFAVSALQLPGGAWWVAAAQAHGQAQLLGWAGLTVLGVAIQFLPRLRGATAKEVATARPALALLVAGLLLRLICQPFLAQSPGGWPALALPGGLASAGLCGLLGATLAVVGLGRALRDGPPLGQREGFRQVLPFLVIVFGSYWAANAMIGAGLVAQAWRGAAMFDARLDLAIVLVASYGFLWPICVAMSARLFPLHLRTALPRQGVLRASLACAAAGLAARLGGAAGAATLDGAGQLLLAASFGLAIAGVGIFGPRRALPRAAVPIRTDPLQLATLTAYGWLAVAAILLALNGLAAAGIGTFAPAGELHAFGAGFVTVLILGVGAALLPGFARRQVRSPALLWPTLLAANLAALARVAPLWFAPVLPPRVVGATAAAAGLCGVLALALFAVNVAGRGGPRARSTRPPG